MDLHEQDVAGVMMERCQRAAWAEPELRRLMQRSGIEEAARLSDVVEQPSELWALQQLVLGHEVAVVPGAPHDIRRKLAHRDLTPVFGEVVLEPRVRVPVR